MDIKDIVSALSRWLHVLAGIIWIGHLYFFNWVNGNFVPTMDAETKKKVVPELMPRALFWFRWGAAFTWITGIILLGMVYYMGHLGIKDGGEWNGRAYAFVALVFVAPFIYDFLAKGPLKDPQTMFFAGGALSSLAYLLFKHGGNMDWRGASIHTGAMFGTIMAFNVWFRIWPNQKIIITGIKNGEAVDAAIPALAGLRSKHNTYMSVPLIFAMLNQHQTWAAGGQAGSPAAGDLLFPLMIFVSFGLTYHFYFIGTKVKGF